MKSRLGRMFISIAVWWLLSGTGRPGPAGSSEGDKTNQSERSLAIIVNTANPVDNLSMAELRRVFLGERSHWPNGRRITLVMMDPGLAERKALLREVCQMSE